MSNSPEAHRLRSLMFRWRDYAGKACDEFRDYKGRKWCARCNESEAAHGLRNCADELEQLLDEASAKVER